MSEIIDKKIIPSSLTITKGRFRKRPVPVEFEVRQREARKTLPSERPDVTLGVVGLVTINPELIHYRLDIQQGGYHKDLRLVQDSSERVTRNNEKLIVNTITKGWLTRSENPVVYAWYDKDYLKTRKSAEAQITPGALSIGCYALRDIMRTVHDTGKLPEDLPLTNDDIRQAKKSEYPGVYVEGCPAHAFFELVESAYR